MTTTLGAQQGHVAGGAAAGDDALKSPSSLLQRQSSPDGYISFVHDSPFEKWALECSRVMAKTRNALPLQQIFSFLPITEVYRHRRCSKRMKELLDTCAVLVATLNPAHIVSEIDTLIADSKVLSAEEMLRPYVALPGRPTPPSILNRYILLLHSEAWSASYFKPCRSKIFANFVGKAKEELLQYRGPPNKNISELLESITVLNKGGYIDIGHSFDEERFPQRNFESIRQTGVLPDPIFVEQFPAEVQEKIEPLHDTRNADLSPSPSERTALLNTQITYPKNIVVGESTALLAYLAYKDGQYDSSVTLWKQASRYNANHPLLHWTNGVLQHYFFKNFQESCLAYTRAILACPQFAYSYYSLAVLASDCGDSDKSRYLYHQALALDPHHHYARMNLLVMCNDRTDDSVLLRHYDAILRIHPTEVSVYRNTARLLLSSNHRSRPNAARKKTAINLLQTAIHIDPFADNACHWFDLGSFMLQQNNIVEARVAFEGFFAHCQNDSMKERVRALLDQLGHQDFFE